MTWAPPKPFEHEIVMWEREEIPHMAVGPQGADDPAFDFMCMGISPGARSRITTTTTFEQIGWKP